MPRPEIIARLHGAYYDWMWDGDNAALNEAYQALLDEAAEVFGCSHLEMRRIASKDFFHWCKQEGLQFPPRNHRS